MSERATSIRRVSTVSTALALVVVCCAASLSFARERIPDFRPPMPPEGDILDPPVPPGGDIFDPPVPPEGDILEAPDDVVLPQRFVRGDADGSGVVELSDAVATLSSLFLGTTRLGCNAAADANDDGALAVSDAIHTLAFLFLGNVQVPQPYPSCGVDATADGLGCEASSSCRPDTDSRAFQITPAKGGYLIDLPEVMVARFPEQSDMELAVDGLATDASVAGSVLKVSPNTLFLETANRTALPVRSSLVLRLQVPARAVRMPTFGFDCGLFVCTCSGDDDCNDLFTGSDCGGDAVCINDGAGGVWCICWRAAQ